MFCKCSLRTVLVRRIFPLRALIPNKLKKHRAMCWLRTKYDRGLVWPVLALSTLQIEKKSLDTGPYWIKYE